MKVRRQKYRRIRQGDIFREIEYIEYVEESKGIIEVSQIVFPLIIVLTQDCDLEQDSNVRTNTIANTQDKRLLSVLVAPLYNIEHVYSGEQLSEIGLKMQTINKTRSPGENLRNNETPRYHYLEFPKEIPVVPSVIDFKHYFSINLKYLENKRKNFICSVSPLYREDISQRFTAYLARIGLP